MLNETYVNMLIHSEFVFLFFTYRFYRLPCIIVAVVELQVWIHVASYLIYLHFSMHALPHLIVCI